MSNFEWSISGIGSCAKSLWSGSRWITYRRYFTLTVSTNTPVISCCDALGLPSPDPVILRTVRSASTCIVTTTRLPLATWKFNPRGILIGTLRRSTWNFIQSRVICRTFETSAAFELWRITIWSYYIRSLKSILFRRGRSNKLLWTIPLHGWWKNWNCCLRQAFGLPCESVTVESCCCLRSRTIVGRIGADTLTGLARIVRV